MILDRPLLHWSKEWSVSLRKNNIDPRRRVNGCRVLKTNKYLPNDSFFKNEVILEKEHITNSSVIQLPINHSTKIY